jgi:hypothetical protein
MTPCNFYAGLLSFLRLPAEGGTATGFFDYSWQQDFMALNDATPKRPRTGNADNQIGFVDMILDLPHSIERLGPYQSLVLLAVPSSVIEPLKLVALAVAGKGHCVTHGVMVVAAYAGSLLMVERLFRIVRPKLLTLPWFARIWAHFVASRAKVVCWFRSWI